MTDRDNWPEQLYRELKRRGVGTLLAFADGIGSTTYAGLAEALESHCTPFQMMIALRNEFVERDDARGFAADCLYRYLHEYVTAHVDQNARRDQQAVDAFAAWEAALGGANDESRLVSRLLRDRVLDGWLPSGPDDLLLVGVMAAQRWRIKT